MTAEVKVQTSNFGADNADGPVIINVTSKSGGSEIMAKHISTPAMVR